MSGAEPRPGPPPGPSPSPTPERTGTIAAAKALLPALKAPRLPPLLPRTSYADFLPEIEAVAEREHSPLARTLVVVLAILVALLLLWAGFSEVDKVTTAVAQVRPFGRVKIINHPDGGIVRVLNVREGSPVRAGDVLAELDSSVVEQELAKTRNEYLTRGAESARLTAELSGAALVFAPEIEAERPDLVQSQRRLFEERQASLAAKLGGATDFIRQKQSETQGLSQQLGKLEEGLVFLVEQEQATGSLADKGYFPRLRYLTIKREVSTLEGQIAQTTAQLASVRSALDEATKRRDAIVRDAATDSLDKLVVARRDRDVAARSYEQNKIRLDALVLRAPVDGIVQKLAVASPGQAVRPGDPVMSVVPTGETLIVEAQVSNTDIGYIEVGQPATVKITTYDHVRYGTLDGVVEQISADAIEDQKTRELTFPVVVRTRRTFLGDKPGQLPVHPGMTAEVDFKLGRRTILSYLTDRVLHTTSNAFKER